jgi:uncharacterized protein (DUF488 family)
VTELTLFTVGHSNRTLEQLTDLLRGARVKILVDVRAYPVSARLPHFSSDSIRATMDSVGITYHWAGRKLGGMRKPRPDSRHLALQAQALRGYADYMETKEFEAAVRQLMALAGHGRTALLCAERQPEHCHRSLIADYLTLNGASVVHLIALAEQREHQLRPEARRESATLIYDRHCSFSLNL